MALVDDVVRRYSARDVPRNRPDISNTLPDRLIGHNPHFRRSKLVGVQPLGSPKTIDLYER